jgi:hypothetical protein
MFRGVIRLAPTMSLSMGCGFVLMTATAWAAPPSAQPPPAPAAAAANQGNPKAPGQPPVSEQGASGAQDSASEKREDLPPPVVPPTTEPSGAPATESDASGDSPPAYYVEPLDGPSQVDRDTSPPTAPATASPRRGSPSHRPIRFLIPEPPPPPQPRHQAPREALWFGARLGWWVPFGDLWGDCVEYDSYGCRTVAAVPFDDYASSGPMFELDVGARLGRNYNVYALWERAQLGAGSNDVDGKQKRAETDFWGLGLRLSTDPDDLGMLIDLAVGVRRFRTIYDSGAELRLSDAPFESRLGLGADIRLGPKFSLSPLLTLGLGSFAKADWVGTDNTIRDAVADDTARMTHGWLTLQLGAHFDLFGRR